MAVRVAAAVAEVARKIAVPVKKNVIEVINGAVTH